MEHGHLNIIVEGNIPFVHGLLEPYAHVSYLPATEITPAAVRDADALLVRTRTRCDSHLLRGSRVSWVGTATIGTDHIDQAWCADNGVTVANAPGCNAPAVAQYVLASVLALEHRPLDRLTIGIVGVGHVGSIVERWSRQLGMRVLLNDPPRQQAEGGDQWSTLERIAAQADIITIHTPLDATTHHLVGGTLLEGLRRRPIIINAARGGIVDTPALIDALDSGTVSHAVIDCWEDEPAISAELLQRCDIATPHIAGYSYEGKVRATRMVIDALTAHYDLPHIDMPQRVPAGACATVTPQAISDSYDPRVDTAALKSDPSAFERLRNTYNLRHEVASQP